MSVQHIVIVSAIYYAKIPEEDRKGSIDTVKYPASLGFTLELCAGTVDKNKPLIEIAREEVLEECGYDVPISKIEEVQCHRYVLTLLLVYFEYSIFRFCLYPH